MESSEKFHISMKRSILIWNSYSYGQQHIRSRQGTDTYWKNKRRYETVPNFIRKLFQVKLVVGSVFGWHGGQSSGGCHGTMHFALWYQQQRTQIQSFLTPRPTLDVRRPTYDVRRTNKQASRPTADRQTAAAHHSRPACAGTLRRAMCMMESGIHGGCWLLAVVMCTLSRATYPCTD